MTPDSEEYQPRPGSPGGTPAPGEGLPDARATGRRGPVARPADDLDSDLRRVGATLAPASELPGGRRRRRTAVAAESQPPSPDRPPDPTGGRPESYGVESYGAVHDGPTDAAGTGAGGGRRGRGGRQRSGRQPNAGRTARAEESADPAGRARDVCLRLLTGTAKTRKQLADALRRREIPDEVAGEVLDRLEEVGLIDDAAFADAWVESRHAGRGLARRALAQELRTRGVAGELVEQAVAQLGADEEAEAARALVERKLRATRGLERQARTRRLVGMLARRGYSEGLAFRVVREALGEEDGTEDDGFGGGIR